MIREALFFCFIYASFMVSCELTESDVEGITYDRVKENEKAVEKLGKLKTRSTRANGRRTLPRGNIFNRARASALQCGGTYDISSEGYRYFKINSKTHMCYHAFLGSRSTHCRVAVLCDGTISMEGPAQDNSCSQEYLKLSDGTKGLMVGCGTFTFNRVPRYARNNGTDIYLYFKGVASQPCVAFCLEDLESGHRVNQPKIITENKAFRGFQMNDECICGKRRDFGRIVGGDEALRYEFPWIGAVVFRKYPSYARLPFCGGALINDRYFISAAHCFAPDSLKAQDLQIVLHAHVMDKRYSRLYPKNSPVYNSIPGWDLPSETDESEESLRVDVEELINHPKFSEETYDWDVTILKLKQRVNFDGGKVSPICLPLNSEVFNYKAGEKHVVAGWGRPSEDAVSLSRTLQKVDVPFVKYDVCKRFTAPARRHLCCGYLEGGKDACGGDSGGPLMYQFKPESNQYILSGVVSAGEGCARREKVGVYTNTMDIVQWIYHHTSDAVWCKR